MGDGGANVAVDEDAQVMDSTDRFDRGAEVGQLL